MNRQSNRRAVNRVAVSGLLTAVMLVLGYLESLLPPIGIPGIKPGLSNSVLLFAIYTLDAPAAYVLMVLKVTLSGLLFGGASAMIYALAGGLASVTVMCLLRRSRPLLASAIGGICHNAAQVGVAMLILHTPVQMLWYLAVLAATGLCCGLLTGIIAERVMRHFAPPVQQKPFRGRILLAVALLACAIAAAVLLLKSNTPETLELPTDEGQVQMLSTADLSGIIGP